MSLEAIIPARNPGWIEPGTTRNPGGRPKDAKILSDAIRYKLAKNGTAGKIADRLIWLSLNAKQDAVQIKAAELVLDRTEGKALQAIQVSQTLDESTARRLVEIGAMLQHIVPMNVVSDLTHPVITLEQAQLTGHSSDIAAPEKAPTKRKYVRSGKYAKANKGRKLVTGEEIAKHESGVGIVASELTAGDTLTNQSTYPTDQSDAKPSVSE